MQLPASMVTAIRILSAAHPAEMTVFVNALSEISANTTKDLIIAPTERVLIHQGRAQILAELVTAIDKARSPQQGYNP